MKYVCPCGYEYDPSVGDPENGVAPGTAWEDVPADFVCLSADSAARTLSRSRNKTRARRFIQFAQKIIKN